MKPQKKRSLEINTLLVEGVSLENIPELTGGISPGVVVIGQDWKDMYFVNRRAGWEEEDYIQFAEKRLRELGIEYP